MKRRTEFLPRDLEPDAPTGETTKTEMVVTMLWQLRSEGWRIIETHESTAPVTN